MNTRTVNIKNTFFSVTSDGNKLNKVVILDTSDNLPEVTDAELLKAFNDVRTVLLREYNEGCVVWEQQFEFDNSADAEAYLKEQCNYKEIQVGFDTVGHGTTGWVM